MPLTPFARASGVAGMLFLSLRLLAAPLSAQTAAVIQDEVTVTTRDGVALATRVFRPAAAGRYPTLVYRTPYDRQHTPAITRAAVARGYAVVVQDVRGRYASAGSFNPYRHDGADGYDTIEWAARQPWSNGAVGTFGLSYPGAVQWLAAKDHPAALRAMVPAMTYSTPETFWYSGGVWDGSWLDWVWYNIAPDLRSRGNKAGPRTAGEARQMADTALPRLRGLPLAALPDFQGLAPWYYDWMTHPPGDPWWSWANLAGQYDGIGAAVLNLSGWFDEPYAPRGAIDNYLGLVASGGRDRAGLILGAWTHGGQQETSAGDRDFGPNARISDSAAILGWMDRFLKGDSSAAPLPIRAYVMGVGQWREFSSWPPPSLRPDTLYLAAEGLARRVRGRTSSHFHSDPAKPLTDPYEGAAGAHNYASLAGRKDLLLFDTRPLERAVEIVGPVTVELTVSATVPDFDIWIQLFDVMPDGSAYNLAGFGGGIQRASYRHGGPERELVTPGQRVKLTFDRLVTANQFLPGHRIRLMVAGSFAPLFSRNLQTGALEFDSARTQPGEITVHHGPGAVSLLILPTVPVPQ
jgi:putative CocE/NonD family hydrolase